MADSRMIENSDRGLTINKSLGWTLATGIFAGGFFLAVELTTTKALVTEVKQASTAAQIEMRRVTNEMDARLRAVEARAAADGADTRAVSRELAEIRGELRAQRNEILTALRGRLPMIQE